MWKLREGVPGVADFAHTALQHLIDAHDALIASREFQIVYANQLRSIEGWGHGLLIDQKLECLKRKGSDADSEVHWSLSDHSMLLHWIKLQVRLT